jgi:hypothetical protein
VDGAGFEPAASTMPTRLQLDSNCLEKFAVFLLVNMRLEKKTVQQNIQDARRFLEVSNYIVNYENVKRYLENYIPKVAKTYNTQITSLRRFIRDFLQVPRLIMSFKMAPIDELAFAKLPKGTVEGLLKDIPKLTEILKYHVVNGAVPAADVAVHKNITTLQGQDVKVDAAKWHLHKNVKINDANVLKADVMTDNGVIHVIDKVLLPK